MSLEFHHYPFTLFDLVAIVLQDKINKGVKDISPFLIANEVMQLHYENLVGLVPLSKTVHELAHSGEIFISLDLVFGNVKEFLRRYKRALNEEQRGQLRKLIELTESMGNDYSPEVLNKRITFLDIENFEKIKRIKKVNEEKNLA